MIFIFDSVEHSGGQRVRLDLQKLNQFSIFPGQVRVIVFLGSKFHLYRCVLCKIRNNTDIDFYTGGGC